MKWENTQTPRLLVVDDNRRIHDDFDLVFLNRKRNAELEADHNALYGRQEETVVSKPGYELDHAFSGSEAIERTENSLAEGRPYQVAFVDIRMPGMDGVETIERLWAIDPRIQMVICTAFSDYRWEDLARRLGQSDKVLVLKKPFDEIEAFQLACTLSEKWFLARQAALKFEHMELLVAQRTQRVLDLQRLEADPANQLERMKLRLLTRLPDEFREALQTSDEPGGVSAGRAERLLRLIDESSKLCHLNGEDLRLQITEGDVVSFLREVSIRLQPAADLKQVQFDFQTNEAHRVARFDAGKLEQALRNILFYLIETAPENSRVSVQVQLDSEALHLVLQNSGRGAAAEKEQWAMESPVDSQSPEVLPSLLLAWSAELIRVHGGILVCDRLASDSEVGSPSSGMRCRISVPLRQDVGIGQPRLTSEPAIASAGPLAANAAEEESSIREQPLILLVHDQAELALSIQQSLEPVYRIALIKDGTQGLIQARELLPDVVIADLAVPTLNGIELCRKLKSDELTSHIPVVLLSARDSESGQLQALEAGADDFILSPFKLSLLKARVDNLQESRHRLRELFKQVKQLYPRDLAANQSDAKFIRRVVDLVEENMADCDFGLDTMARNLGVSRRQLFRKLRAAAGCSPNTFIRTLRLQRAAQLLTETQMTVTEITYAVGFSDLKYFRTIFREYFGVAPGEYLKRSKTQ